MSDRGQPLSRTEASRAVEAAGWRLLLGTFCASVPVHDLERGLAVANAAVTAAGEHADGHLRIDLRPERVELSLQTRESAAVTRIDAELAHRISEALADLGVEIAPPTSAGSLRPVQVLELAIDAMDIPGVRPFWKAVLALSDQPGEPPETGGLVDPAGQLPNIWFQQMDEPRAQRNRIHFDITVADDEAEHRVQAALAEGGHLVNDGFARMFWVLADPEGNECCVCTWTDRDEWESSFGDRP